MASAAASGALIESFWPVAHERLVTALRAAGADPDRAEEAVAEAFTRALARRLVVADVDEFCRWAFVVARNALVDVGRKSRWVVLLDVMPEPVDSYDLAAHVESRQRLRDAKSVIAAMSDTDRRVLLEGVHGADGVESTRGARTRQEAVTLAVRRHRARARLRDALGAPVAWVASRKPRWLARCSGLPAEAWEMMLALPLLAVSGGWFAPAHAMPAQATAVRDERVAVAAAPSTESPSTRSRTASAAPGATAPPAEPPGRGGERRRDRDDGIVTVTPADARTDVTITTPTGDDIVVGVGVSYTPTNRLENVRPAPAQPVVPSR